MDFLIPSLKSSYLEFCMKIDKKIFLTCKLNKNLFISHLFSPSEQALLNPLRGPRSGIQQGKPEASICCVTCPPSRPARLALRSRMAGVGRSGEAGGLRAKHRRL
jgi:hypothetical protein